MKKYILSFIVLGLVVLAPASTKAVTLDDLAAQIQSLTNQVVTLKAQLAAQAYRAVSPTPTLAPVITPQTVVPTTNTVAKCVAGITSPYIKIISPNGGEVYTKGQIINITWKNCNQPSNGYAFISVHGPTNFNLTQDIVPINNGSYSWTIPGNNDPLIPATGGLYKIGVACLFLNGQNCPPYGSAEDTYSANPFTIKPSKYPPDQTVVKTVMPASTTNYINQAIEFATKASDSVSKSSLSNADKATAIGFINNFITFLQGKRAAPTTSNEITSFPVGFVGPDVVRLQNKLITKRYLILPAGVTTGYWGRLSADALAKYLQISVPPTDSGSGYKCNKNEDCGAGQECFTTNPPGGLCL